MVDIPNSPDSRRESLLANDFLVGIGSSAGGLKALEAFFQNLSVDSGAAFVVVQHLSPDFRSLTRELLQKRTKMPVCTIENGIIIQINTIYVLSQISKLTLQGNQLFLEDHSSSAMSYPIDRFFLSLAQERGNRSMGILLSGTGHDGTEGLKAISRAGGIALVQSQEKAQFRAMPTNPISSGLVDEILSPEELAKAVCDIIHYTSNQEILTTNDDSFLPSEQLTKILDILHQQENIDFSQYKTSTLYRRIAHRLLILKVNTIEQYVNDLSNNPEEVKNLRQDILIGATRFFRDPQIWIILQNEILPAIIESLAPKQPLRLWVAGCSTGEEAYSLAISIAEVLRNMKQEYPVKLFATDIDKEALFHASQGIYEENIAESVSEEILERYFVFEGKNYKVKQSIRSKIIFASHDITKNPGFSHMNLVSCRNMLIYMQPILQEQVLNVLHFSLISNGILILGPSENLGPIANEFESVNQHWKIFRKCRDVQLPVRRNLESPLIQPVTFSKSTKILESRYEKMLAAVFKLRFRDNPITCVLVNQNYEIIHIFLNTAHLLEFPLGEINTNILKIVPRSLKIPLSSALQRCKLHREPILYGDLKVLSFESEKRINLWVGIGEELQEKSELSLVVLLEVINSTQLVDSLEELDFDLNSDLSEQIREIEFELQQTRNNLQATIEELETANEELLASNEELQSTNEELQSVNEELYSVNVENQERIEQLTELSADIDTLLKSTDIGVVFLDQELNIRKFTPAASQVFNFRMTDTGRPLTELVNYLDIDNLMSLIEEVVNTETIKETEANNVHTGDRLLLRILPYRREDSTVNGIVLIMIVINDLKRVQEALTQNEMLLRTTLNSTSIILFTQDRNLLYTWIHNPIPGFSREEMINHHDRDFLSPQEAQEITDMKQAVLDTDTICSGEITFRSRGPTRYFNFTFAPLHNSENEIVGITGVGVDISKNKENETQLLQITQRLQQAQQIAKIGDWEYYLNSNEITLSPEVYNIIGFNPSIGPPSVFELFSIVYPEDRPSLIDLFNQIQNSSSPIDIDIRIYPQGSNTLRYINIIASRDSTPEGITKLNGTLMDITDRKNAQNDLHYRAFFDFLTNLPNRASFLENLKSFMARANLDVSSQFTLLYLDLDGFKQINDTLGHSAGDQLLIEVAQRLEHITRPGDIVCRLGGDEFAILLERTSQLQEALDMANRIQMEISRPFIIASSQLYISASIGIDFYLSTNQSYSETTILENADIAMYQAKNKGSGRIEVFNPSMRAEQEQQMEIKVGLRQALEQNQFTLYYQPLLRFSSQSIIGFEVLLRWQHPRRGLLTPMEFLPIIESSNYMSELESWIFEQACAQLSQWNQRFGLKEKFYLDVNISPGFIKYPNFINNLNMTLRKYEINPEQICLELTENSFIGYGNSVGTLLLTLKNIGFNLALDDFGTGYSSLSYLHRLPIDTIKIDQSFVQSLPTNSSTSRITRAIIVLASQLEVVVIAEGIETVEQFNLLQELGCDYGQGYFFSYPLIAAEAESLIANPGLLQWKQV